MINFTQAQEEWQQYYICDVGNDATKFISTDAKDLLSDTKDLGLVEPNQCLSYCKEQKTEKSISEETCCNHARYYYTATGEWAADCSLTSATEISVLEDEWDEAAGEYITYQAVLLKADGDDSLVSQNYDSATGALGQPADWKLSKTWRDGYYCDVETTDYEYIAEPDTYWTGLQSREACLEFCYRNMKEYEATCCGQAWLYQYATNVT